MLSYRTCLDIIKRHILCFLLYISRFVLWQHGFAQFFKMKKKLPIILLTIYLITLLMITIFRPWRGSYHFMGGTLNLTLFIETTQYILGTGISEIDDLILNTFGSLIGWGIGSCILGIVRKYKKI